MRKRKTSHQPNFKAARVVVLGQDGVGKSGKLLTSYIIKLTIDSDRAVQYWILSPGKHSIPISLSASQSNSYLSITIVCYKKQ